MTCFWEGEGAGDPVAAILGASDGAGERLASDGAGAVAASEGAGAAAILPPFFPSPFVVVVVALVISADPGRGL
jgi:hypothetical protein